MSSTKSQDELKEAEVAWPDDGLPPDLLAKLNERISKFLSEQPESPAPDAGEKVKAKFDFDEGASAAELKDDLYKIIGLSNYPHLKERLPARDAEWKTFDPKYAQIRNFINLLIAGEFEEASKNFEESEEYKKSMIAEGVTQAKSQAATDSANKGHAEKNRTKAEAIRYFKKNRSDFTSKKDAARKLEKLFPPLSFRTYYDAIKGFDR